MPTFLHFSPQNIFRPVILMLGLTNCIKTNTLVRTVTRTDTMVVARDTISGDLQLTPSGGDDYPQLQKTIDYCLSHPGHRILLGAGHYPISHPLIIARKAGGTYVQVTIDIEGATNAKDALDTYCSVIVPQFTNTFALGIQFGKGCQINNLKIVGQYVLPRRLSTIQIDTLSWNDWDDGKCSDGRTNPYSAIVIDPFCDPSYIASDSALYHKYAGLDSFYLPGMSRSGSTAINISGCCITGFVIGVMVTPSYQQNGELINVLDSRIDYCRVCYAYSQAQSKANQLNDLMCWGGVHTVLDGLRFGLVRGDGSTAPMVDVMNVAGSVYELVNVSTVTYPLSMNNVFAEGLFKLGQVIGRSVTSFNNFQVNFQLTAGMPAPDFYFIGAGATFTNCMLRVYNGQQYFNRITFNSPGVFFNGGLFSSPPIAINGQNNIPGPQFSNVTMYYTGGYLSRNNYDTLIPFSNSQTVRVSRANYNGYFISENAGAFLKGDVLLTAKMNEGGGTPRFSQPVMNYQYPLGFVSAIGGDTVYLQNMGVGIRDNIPYKVWIARIKLPFPGH
jgi:hypothetical protein